MRRPSRPRQAACPAPGVQPHSGVMTVLRSRARLALLALPAALLLAACRVERADAGRPGGAVAAPPADSAATAQVLAALRLYYARLSGRELRVLSRSFWPRATITSLMGTPSDTTAAVRTLTIEELAGRGRAAPECRASFSDEMAHASVATYGPLAQAWVTYRARCGVTRDSVATHYGVDAFLLLRHQGEWRISGLALARELPDQPLARSPAP
jgi:hypothetical protein